MACGFYFGVTLFNNFMFLLKVTMLETYENIARKRHYRFQRDNLHGNPCSSELTTSIAPYQTSVIESAYYSMFFARYFCSLLSSP
ncbi:hypothetical protein ARMSODRAFT_481058 [Armillaria solidipes]|uniref:Uncharacterized protein n=1 Tax=Armillaria solidipes TaxID=1076256 RepID=A0A2H3CH37_9AGAR|nr:hypothetical protein ARMSODRAFT_481058 [Armillaria solidipes]